MKLKKFIHLSFFCCAISVMIAQTPGRNPINEIEKLLDSTYTTATEGNLHKSIVLANKAIVKSKTYKYDEGLAWGNFYLGQSLLETGIYNEALSYLRNAEKNKYTSKDTFLQFEILRVRARALASMSLFQEAITQQERGLKIIPKINKKEEEKLFLKSVAYQNLALYYNANNKRDSTFYYSIKNKELLENLKEDRVYYSLINVYSELGAYHTHQKEFEKSENYFRKSLELAKKYNYPYKAYNFTRWAEMELLKNNTDIAIDYLIQAIENSKETNRKSEMPEIYGLLAKAYQQKGLQDLGNKYKLLSLEIENEIKSSQIKSNQEILKLLVDQQTTQQKGSFRIILISIIGAVVLLLLILHLLFRKKFNSTVTYFRNRIADKRNKIERLEQQQLKEHAQLLEIAQSGNRDFWIQFQQVYPSFKEKLLEVNPKLTTSELTLAAYIVLDFNTRETADMTFRAYKTVETTRYNLRKKLNLSPEIKIDLYLKEFLK